MKKQVLTYVVILLCCTSSWAQCTLKGKVLDADRHPAAYANVGTINLSDAIGTAADEKGRFLLTLPADTLLTIRFSCIGQSPFDIQVRLRHGEVLDTTVAFSSKLFNMDEVVVQGEKERTSAFTKIESERLEKIVGPNSGVENLLKTLPDVASNNELSSHYSVRGGSYDENLVYINGVEIYRPILVRSGQQEGMSIINPDLIDNIRFSPGGFQASYGDKMASVLDLVYSRPSEFKAKVSASMLGVTASAQGLLDKAQRLSYSFGFRQHSNNYVFRSLETEGDYTTNYTDFQTVLGYRGEKVNMSFLGIYSRNIYGLVPQSRTTMFGGFQEQMQLDVYFDGQELDRYRTLLGALTLDYHPNEDFQLLWTTSVQDNDEREIYDIQSQYWLYQVNVGSTDPDNSLLDRGVGTYLEHARNLLSTNIASTELKATRFVALGQWDMGLRLQRESVNDRVREWMWVDSAGFTMPVYHDILGDTAVPPRNPMLQNFCRAHNAIATNRAMAYVQRSINLVTRHNDEINILLGLRAQMYGLYADTGSTSAAHINTTALASPRASVSFKPKANQDIVYRLAAGIYHQPPFYREYRHDDGRLNLQLKPQHSYQVMGTADWNLHLWQKPFHLTTDIYYKYITDLVPYRIDNLRIRYDANNDAVGYVAGLSLRLSGEFVPGLESWASLSLMQTQEDLLGDTLGWLARPTDQRFSFKLFFQDYIPTIPFWRMALNFIYASGLPVTAPNQKDRSVTNRLPSYFRIDWGNTIELSRFERFKNAKLFQKVDDVMVSLEVFNLFNYRNVVSYMWVADYDNVQYHVPNFLTARQLNLKLTVTF
ncbi:MAG: TonB-dependent receptor [Bacteroidales bacterium]|nr:TonB-dependent receptor [Bacteroidales bacterium]